MLWHTCPHLFLEPRVELQVPGAEEGGGDVQPLAVQAAAGAAGEHHRVKRHESTRLAAKNCNRKSRRYESVSFID